MIIYESLGLFALSNPCVTRASSLLMIYESLGAVWAVAAMRHPSHQFVDHFFFFGKLTYVLKEEFVDHLCVPKGSLRCRIRASPVTAVH